MRENDRYRNDRSRFYCKSSPNNRNAVTFYCRFIANQLQTTPSPNCYLSFFKRKIMSGIHTNIRCLISDLFYELSTISICNNPKISHCYAFSCYWTSLYLFSCWFSQELEMLQLSTAWFACFQHSGQAISSIPNGQGIQPIPCNNPVQQRH